METGPFLRHLVFQVHLDAIPHIHVERQRAGLELTGFHPVAIPFQDIHLALRILQHQFTLHVHFHHARRPLVVTKSLVDRQDIEGLHGRIRRTDRRSRFLDLFPPG